MAAADLRRTAFTRTASRSGEWFTTRVTIVPDFRTQQLGWSTSTDGRGRTEGIFLERSGRTMLGKEIGNELEIRTPAGEVARVPIAGFVHDTAIAPSTQDRVIYAYITPTSAARIGQDPDFDQLLVKMKSRSDLGDAMEFAEDLKAWLLKARNQTPLRADVIPDAHPHAALMSTMLRVLETLAVIAFTSSAALASYMISLWMKREMRQVGIMKAIGARFSQIAAQYFALVAPVVLLSVAVALPIGAAIGKWIARYYEGSLNIDVADWSVPGGLLIKEALVAVVIPLLAMALPIVRAARVTARKAIQDPGIVAPRSALARAARFITIPGIDA